MALHAQLDALKHSLEGKIVSPVLQSVFLCEEMRLTRLSQDFVGQDLVEQRARHILWTAAVSSVFLELIMAPES